MPFITLATLICAAPDVCCDLARDAQLHVESARQTGERIVAGRATGLWQLNDEITFEGKHLGVRQRFTARVAALERPDFFTDEMTRGAFARMKHTHIFQALPGEKTRMIDVVEWRAPLGLAGALVSDKIIAAHLSKFLRRRAWHIKMRAQTKQKARNVAGLLRLKFLLCRFQLDFNPASAALVERFISRNRVGDGFGLGQHG